MDPARETSGSPERKTIAAAKVGLTLTLTDEAMKGFDHIQEETIKSAEKDQNFSWR